MGRKWQIGQFLLHFSWLQGKICFCLIRPRHTVKWIIAFLLMKWKVKLHCRAATWATMPACARKQEAVWNKAPDRKSWEVTGLVPALKAGLSRSTAHIAKAFWMQALTLMMTENLPIPERMSNQIPVRQKCGHLWLVLPWAQRQQDHRTGWHSVGRLPGETFWPLPRTELA